MRVMQQFARKRKLTLPDPYARTRVGHNQEQTTKRFRVAHHTTKTLVGLPGKTNCLPTFVHLQYGAPHP